jgi:hypothetical protein
MWCRACVSGDDPGRSPAYIALIEGADPLLLLRGGLMTKAKYGVSVTMPPPNDVSA